VRVEPGGDLIASHDFRVPQSRVLVAAALALATGLVAWVALSYDGWTRHGTSTPPATATAAASTVGPVGLDEAGLRAEVEKLGQPVYWLGPEDGVTYELKRTSDGSVFLRYLPNGVAVGEAGPYRTVGTYPFPTAYGAVKRLSQEADTVWFKVRDGGLAVFRRARPTNVYLAWPGFAYQVEVYDPVGANAKRLAASAQLRRLAGT